MVSDGAFSSGSGWYPERGRCSSGHGDRRNVGHDGALPLAPQSLVRVWGGVGYDQERGGGEVPEEVLEMVVSGGH